MNETKKQLKTKIMKTINEAIKEKSISFMYHKNAPCIDFLEVVKETEKAVCVKHSEVNKNTWLPKSAFEAIDFYGVTHFTLKSWFKSKLEKWQLRNLNVIGY